MSTPDTLEFRSRDGTALVGDLVMPADPVAAAIVCHPHPQYGGDRFNHVVTALFDALASANVATLRFDFREDYSGGEGEVLDARAALDLVADRAPGVPLVALGYSFGAMIVLALDDPRVVGSGLVAPPLSMGRSPAAPAAPTLVITPAHDQFCPPAAAEAVVAGWADAAGPIDHLIVEMADHSLVGHTAAVADDVVDWLRRRLPLPSLPSPRR